MFNWKSLMIMTKVLVREDETEKEVVLSSASDGVPRFLNKIY